MATKIRVINALGVLQDCKAGKVYRATDVVPGVETTLFREGEPVVLVVAAKGGYTFRDEVGDSVALQLSTVDDQFGIDWEFAE